MQKLYQYLVDNSIDNYNSFDASLRDMDDNNFKGLLFELYCYAYLAYTATIKGKNNKLWLWPEVPIHLKEEILNIHPDAPIKSLIDRGGDLIRFNGILQNYDAIQCKFRSNRHLTYTDIATFLSFCECSRIEFRKKIIFTNCTTISLNANHRKGYKIILLHHHKRARKGDKILQWVLSSYTPIPKSTFQLRDYQQPIVEATIQHFKQKDRGCLYLYCGSGKTKMALYSTLALGCKRIVFVAPYISLCIQTIKKAINTLLDSFNIKLDTMTFSSARDNSLVCSTSEIFKDNYMITVCNNSLSKFVSILEEDETIALPDMWILDESHHFMNNNFIPRWLTDKGIRGQKQKVLFMTATPEIKTTPLSFNMPLTGPIIASRSIREGIKDGALVDYSIRLYLCSLEDEYGDNIKTDLQDNIIDTVTGQKYKLRSTLIRDAIRHDLEIGKYKKPIIFCANKEKARAIETALKGLTINDEQVPIYTVFAETPTHKRNAIFTEFEESEYCILINVKIITEGLDLTTADAVVLCCNKKDRKELFQIICRCLRAAKGKLRAYICLPIFMDKQLDLLKNIIETLGEKDDEFNREVQMVHSKTKSANGGGSRGGNAFDEVNITYDLTEIRKQLKILNSSEVDKSDYKLEDMEKDQPIEYFLIKHIYLLSKEGETTKEYKAAQLTNPKVYQDYQAKTGKGNGKTPKNTLSRSLTVICRDKLKIVSSIGTGKYSINTKTVEQLVKDKYCWLL